MRCCYCIHGRKLFGKDVEREREKRLTINIKLFFIPWFVLGPSQEVDGNSFEFTKEYVKLS